MIQLPVLSNLLLQILLYINVNISCSWAVSYAVCIIAHISEFYNYYGAFIIIAFIVGVVTEYWRIYAGYTGNLKDRLADFSVFFILSPLVQLPILLFIYLFFFIPHIVLQSLTIMLFICMMLELLVGLYAWNHLSQRQAELFQLKLPEIMQRQSKALI